MGECMTNQNEQFPKIRFHNYCDEWKQQKLGEVFEQTVEYVDPCEQNLELWSVTVESGLTPKEERYNREFLVKKSDKFKKLYPEEIVYNPMNITIGAVGFNNAGKEVAVSGYYVTMKMKSKFSNKFFSAWLSCPKAIRLYKIYSTGSLIERQRVQFPTLSDIKDYFPTFEEQSAIGSLFCTLDDLLESYKDNLTNYQSLKATMLAKMFPKAGQTVPEIRIDGFEGEWKKLKLRDVVYTNPKSELPENFKYIDLESVVGTRIEKIREESKEFAPSRAQRLAKKGDVFYQTVRPYQKNNYLFKLDEVDYVFSTGYAQLRPIYKSCDSDFLLILLQNNRFLNKVLDRCTGTSYPAINVNDLIEILIAIPSYEEQQVIGAYFSNLDNLINSYQEKLSQLETLKKKLLQDMFI